MLVGVAVLRQKEILYHQRWVLAATNIGAGVLQQAEILCDACPALTPSVAGATLAMFSYVALSVWSGLGNGQGGWGGGGAAAAAKSVSLSLSCVCVYVFAHNYNIDGLFFLAVAKSQVPKGKLI
jgi:hypothetical protein